MEIFFIVNVITGKATVSAPTREQIERVYHYTDAYFKKRGPEQVICSFSRSIGITLSNFAMYPKSMITNGIVNYARSKNK